MNDFGPAAAIAAIMLPIAFAIKAIADARLRSRLIASDGSDELLRALLVSDEERRRFGALRWGVVLTCLGIGFALIGWFGWDVNEPPPGVFAVLLLATGVGNLAFFALAHYIRLHGPKGPSA